MREKLKNRNGQILVEAMVALGIIVVGLLGMMNLLSTSIGLNKVVADQYVASYLASEGIEMVKNNIDNNVANGDAYNTGFDPGKFYEVGYMAEQSGHAGEGWTVYKKDYPNEQSVQYIKFDNNLRKYNYQTGNETKFKRIITIRYGTSGDEMIVNSKVYWITRGGGTMDINVEDHFTNWTQ